MPYAILDKDNRLFDVFANKPPGKSVFKLSDDDMAHINASRQGHSEFIIEKNKLVHDPKPVVVQDEKVSATMPTGFQPVLQSSASPNEVGSFGNIWLRKIFFKDKGEVYEGHKHPHDHVSLLMSGSVSVAVPGHKQVTFTAPTYIIIRAEYEHEITALEDNTLWWCLHAMRDEAGEVVDLYSELNDPLAHPI